MICVLFVVGAFQSPAATFDAIQAAHAKQTQVSSRVVVTTKQGGTSQKSTLEVFRSQQGVMLHVQEPPQPGLDRSDRTFILRGSTLSAYDARANEWLERPSAPGPNEVTRLRASLGDLPEAASVLLSAPDLSRFLGTFRSLPGWQVQGSKIFRQDAKGSMSLTVRDTKFLAGLHFTNGSTDLQWTITPIPMRPFRLSVPSDARHVASFTAVEAPPTFASEEAHQLYLRLLSAGSKLRSATVGIDTNDGPVRLVFDGRRVRETQAKSQWAYDGRTLTVNLGRTGRFFQGKVNRPDALDALTSLGIAVDPLTRVVLMNGVPFKSSFATGERVSIAGSMVVQGVSSSLLRSVGKQRIVSLVIRRDLNLPASMNTDLLDRNGRTISSSSRVFTYGMVNKPQSPAEFSLSIPPGTRFAPLPVVKR